MRRLPRVATLVLVATLVAQAAAQTLRIGLAADPDMLDPSLARSAVGRVVFAALCDKLFDIDRTLDIVPQLATSYEWSADNRTLTLHLRGGVTFHDGEKLDAAAVKYSLERHKSIAGSSRRGDLAPVASIEVVDRLTVRLTLSAPYSPLLAQLADRAGMIVSPKAAQAQRDKFSAKPVCAGPFRFAERVPQDRIVLERYPGYWRPNDIHFERIVYLPIPDPTVRLSNLRAGQLDLIEGVAASDLPKVRSDVRLRVAKVTGIGWTGITFNVGKSELARKNPLGRDARVREAFELAIDRDAIVAVVQDGEAMPGNQWVSPANGYYAKSVSIPKRDVARARALLKEAGVVRPTFTLIASTAGQAQRLAEVVQAMSREAGFDVRIRATEFATALDLSDKGQYEAMIDGWSGRADPDGNVYSFYGCDQPLNTSGYCKPEVDALLQRARELRNPSERRAVYDQIARIVLVDRPTIYLYHGNSIWAYQTKLAGFEPYPDGLVRVQGLRFQ